MKEESLSKNTFTRRVFLSGLAATGVVAAAGLAGCKEQAEGTVSDNGSDNSQLPEPDKTIDTDIVIVGAGLSGLACAVQARYNDKKVVLLEKLPSTGGNGIGVEGIFAVGSSAQQEKGIHVDGGEIVREELSFAQWRPNGLLYRDLVDASANNYDWLVEQGVKFSGVVDDYNSPFSTFHWFEENVAAVGYVPAMTAKAEELGVEILLETSATSLLVENGEVVGAYAENEADGMILINANAVVLATGGMGGNPELLKKAGFPGDRALYSGVPGHDGDGYTMAMAVGANDVIHDVATISGVAIDGVEIRTVLSMGLTRSPQALWVTDTAERFIDESFFIENAQNMIMPTCMHDAIYAVVDQSVLDAATGGAVSGWAVDDGRTPQQQMDDALAACPSDNIFKASSISELGEAIGIDGAALELTVSRYNTQCSAGHDEDFGKPAEFLTPLGSAPYYIARFDPGLLVAIGGIDTNRDMQVIDEEKKPIEGLYAIGVDGARLYRHVYPINVPGSCCANNINSARTAANVISDKPRFTTA